jgi:predicted acyltransferase
MKTLTERFTALDVFRGMTICFMIIVNTPGAGADSYAPLNHAEWFGFTPTDLVFPSFLFAVGNALSFSGKKYETNAAFLKKILKRTVLIFLLGYLMYWFPFFHPDATGALVLKPIAHTRIMGVLQRIALCYFFGALIVRYFSLRSAIIISVILLFGYWAFLYAFGDAGQELTMFGNAGTHLDLFVLGNNHMYINHSATEAFDPEGLLSTLPSIVNVVVGFAAGTFIQKAGKNFETVSKLLMMGCLLVFAGLFWGQFFPLAKKLWTSSFVLLTVGIDLMLIGILIYAIEIKQWKFGKNFFLVFGKNSLPIYLLSELLATTISLIMIQPGNSFYNWINTIFFQNFFPGPFGVLLFSLCFMLFCWMVGWILDKRKIYIKV